MEGSARGAPFCNRGSSFVLMNSLSRVEKNRENRRRRQRRIERIGRREESRDSVAVRARTHCKEAFHNNTNRAIFPTCCCSCVSEFMNGCLYVLMICCRCMLDVHLQG
jgi:hypothetical protein